MEWFNNSPKSVNVEELVKRCITNYADKRTFSVSDKNRERYTAVVYDYNFVNELSSKLVKEVFGVLFSQLSSNQGNKDSRNTDDILSLLNRINTTTFDGLTYVDKKGGHPDYTLLYLKNKQAEMSNTLEAIQTELSRLSQVQETVIRENNSIIQKQHDSLLRYDNDLLYKSKNHLLNEVIGIADQIKQIEEDQVVKEDFSKLLEDVHALGEWVDATLQTESVRKYEYAKQDKYKFDSKYQEIVETQYTSVPEEDGTYKTMLPGYFWTIPMVGSSIPQSPDNAPKSFEFILRHEQVIRLKYKPASTSPDYRVKGNDYFHSIQNLDEDKNSLPKDSTKTQKVDDILNQHSSTESNKGNDELIKQAEQSTNKNAIVFANETSSNGQSLLLSERQIVLEDSSSSKTKSKTK